jgi:methyl-accepting chemotaxis protein-1 (serine sensor receptor)
MTTASIVFGLLAGVFTFVSLRRAIGRPLAEALEHFHRIATGDLSQRIETRSHDGHAAARSFANARRPR